MIANAYGLITPREGYRDFTVPTEAAFTWEAGITQTGPNGLYGVEFTSVQDLDYKAEAPTMFVKLHALDDAARIDAEGQPGFNMYFADEVSEAGMARSFCLWDTAKDAERASRREQHQAAVGFTFGEGKRCYDYYGIKKFTIKQTDSGLIFITVAHVAVSRGVVVVNERVAVDGPPPTS